MNFKKVLSLMVAGTLLISGFVSTKVNAVELKGEKQEELYSTIDEYNFSNVKFMLDEEGNINYSIEGANPRLLNLKAREVDDFLENDEKEDIIKNNIEMGIETLGARTTNYYFVEDEDGEIRFLSKSEVEANPMLRAPNAGYFAFTISASPSQSWGKVTYWTQAKAEWKYPASSQSHSAAAKSDDILQIHSGDFSFTNVSKAFSGNYNSYTNQSYDTYHSAIPAYNISQNDSHAAWRFRDYLNSGVRMKVVHAGAGFTKQTPANRPGRFMAKYTHTYTSTDVSLSFGYQAGYITITNAANQWGLTAESNLVNF